MHTWQQPKKNTFIAHSCTRKPDITQNYNQQDSTLVHAISTFGDYVSILLAPSRPELNIDL